MQRLLRAGSLALVATVTTACAQDPAVEATAMLSDEQDIFDLQNRHADLDVTLNETNVKDLKHAWHFDTPAPVTHTPLVYEGHVYFGDWDGNMYAIDLNTGKKVWEKNLYQPKKKWPWHGLAGTGAIAEVKGRDLLFEASVEGTAYALDPATGEVAWKTPFTDHPLAGNVGSLLYHGGLLYIPVQSVAEPLSKKKDLPMNFRGKVVALNATTGETVWETYTVDKPHNGAAVWSSFALDPELGVLYFNTGNNYTGEATPLSDAMLAVDAKTGKIKWSDQVTSHDIWTMAEPKGPDYDFGAGPQLFEAEIDGEMRNLVGAGQKSGTFYVWDRESGEPVWTTTVGYGNVGGGIHAEGSVGNGRIFLWGNNAYPYKNPKQHPMDIKAVDASSGKYLWVTPKAQPALLTSAGYLAGDVYFVGSLDGQVRAYSAADGRKLWTSQPHGAVGSSLVFEEGTLLWGGSAPPRFGGTAKPNGVFAYQLP
ncbi:MAG: PQQ-binding-like beta-propeller repeat protein [Halomonas sp.]|nr:PQQ-binding-like beta-propeller repeat protein [Halomonas sp.]